MKRSLSTLVQNSAIIFGGNTIANITNYAYNIIMARFLGPELFASLVALLATMTIVGIPAMAILLGFTTFAADFKGSPGKIRYLWISGLRTVGIAGVIIAAIAIALAGPVLDFLNVEHTLPYILLMASIPVGLLAAINRGLVQGMERFWSYAASISGEGITKVVLGLLFVLGGYQLGGATAALLGAGVVAFLLPLPALRPLLRVQAEPFPRRTLLSYSVFTTFVTLVIILFLNADVIAAKAFLPADVAGRYAAASTIAKIIPYAVSAVVSAMLPRIAQLVTKQERDTPVLIEATVLTLMGSLAIYAVYLLVPETVLGVLYGTLYLDAAPLLGTLGGAMLTYALANVFLTYFLSTKDTRVTWALTVSGLALLTLLFRFHASAEDLADAVLGSTLVLLASVGATYVWTKRARLVALFQRT